MRPQTPASTASPSPTSPKRGTASESPDHYNQITRYLPNPPIHISTERIPSFRIKLLDPMRQPNVSLLTRSAISDRCIRPENFATDTTNRNAVNQFLVSPLPYLLLLRSRISSCSHTCTWRASIISCDLFNRGYLDASDNTETNPTSVVNSINLNIVSVQFMKCVLPPQLCPKSRMNTHLPGALCTNSIKLRLVARS